MTDWCILRTSGSATLNLARSLSDAGFGVWSPIEIIQPEPKAPDTLLMRKPRQVGPVTKPLISAIVFAPATDLAELVAMSHSPAQTFLRYDKKLRRMVLHGHPDFSVFRDGEKFALIRDDELEHLRLMERKRKPRGQVKTYSIGARVKLTTGAYAGLRGTVSGVKGKDAKVTFGERGFVHDATLPMWMLLDDVPAVHVGNAQSEQARVARAA